MLVYVLALSIGHYYIHEYVDSGLFFLVLIFYSYLNIKQFASEKINLQINQIIWLFFMTLLSYHNFGRYEEKQLLLSYSKAFNDQRKRLELPIIPQNWETDVPFGKGIEWHSKGDSMGHYSKYIGLGKDKTIQLERDDYNLRKTDKIARSISIFYCYRAKNHPDTLKYFYSIGDSSRQITRAFADSLFNAEHIQKDY